MSLHSIEEKKQRISELKAALAKLENQLNQDIESSQHQVIDDLDDYFNAVETKFSSLKMFWQSLRNEWRKTSSNKEM